MLTTIFNSLALFDYNMRTDHDDNWERYYIEKGDKKVILHIDVSLLYYDLQNDKKENLYYGHNIIELIDVLRRYFNE